MQVTPLKDSDSSKKQQVEQMFDNIAVRYDLLNQLLSFGRHNSWRRKVVRLMREFALNFSKPIRIIDIATGTGDLALECLKLNPAKITGIDIAEQMLIKGREKIKQQNADHIIELINADSESIPFPEESFETATVAFGIRNFENLDKGLKEIQRVLVQGGELFILEFSKPRGILIKPFYHFYLSVICPVIGRIISGDPHAYGYLFRSINEFPFGEKMADIIKRAGFSKVSIHPLTLGVVTIYHAKK